MPWRGRFLASDTIRKHAAKGVRYRHEFEHSVLTSSTVENIALKMALTQVIEWFEENDRNNMVLQEARLLLRDLYHVAEWEGRKSELVRQLSRKLHIRII